jgi:hypothetical protein
VEYSDRPPSGRHGYERGYVDVSITIYSRRPQALAALKEAAYGSQTTLPNGATVREALNGGGIQSVLRYVFIDTASSYPYVDGRPDHRRAPAFGASVQMTIQRRVQAAVLQLR